MPLHDWTRVDPNDYHDFHLTWIAGIKVTLNTTLLPPGYFAMAEHTVSTIVPDVVTLTRPADGATRPVRPGTSPGAGNPAGGVVVAEAPPTARVVASGRGRPPAGRRRVAVRHARGRELVAVVELVSPSNKAKAVEFADLVGKSAGLLHQGVHLLVVDPFPPTRRDPNGIHGAIWKAATRLRYDRPADKPLTAVAYKAGEPHTAYVEPLAVGDPLPTLPLFLTPDLYVNVPLEATYQDAWRGFADDLRPLVEGGAGG